MIIPVILSGGVGSRLWPLSRELFPKQFMSLTGRTVSMFQDTVARLAPLEEAGPPMVVCNDNHRFMAAAQLQDLGLTPAAIILEPVGRNTAPAAAVAALEALEHDTDPLLLILPADHLLQDAEAFARAASLGADLARQGRLVTFGIVPTRPETGYGYIKKQAPVLDGHGTQGFAVAEFREKPDAATAREYVESGDYLWNSGMFLFSARTYLDELDKHAPDMAAACVQALDRAYRDLDFLRLDPEAFARVPADSIDYAVMEKTDKAAVIPLDAGWSDVGSWASLWEVSQRDADGNAAVGDAVLEDCTDCHVHAGSRMVAALGLSDTVIVETADAVLVAPRDKVQDIKKIVTRLKNENRPEAVSHRKVYRPWGAYESIDVGGRFQVKRITVNPGATLSLQKHHHRAEHWVVVSGTAVITRGDTEHTLSEDQSTYIPLGTVHRLQNPGKIPLELIEVQTGSYLGEDDIVRLEDVYGRQNP
jgi:mannose-1-phosphate guanylyltransferase/mannose-6-phosphate isomerase